MSSSEQLKQYNGEPAEGATASTESNNAIQPSNANSSKPEQVASRQKSLQKIQQKKQAVLSLPCNEKLLKLAIYSKCQVLVMYSIYIFSIYVKLLFRLINVSAWDGKGLKTFPQIFHLAIRVAVNIC